MMNAKMLHGIRSIITLNENLKQYQSIKGEIDTLKQIALDFGICNHTFLVLFKYKITTLK